MVHAESSYMCPDGNVLAEKLRHVSILNACYSHDSCLAMIRLFFDCGTPTGVQDREGRTILYRAVDSVYYEGSNQDKSLALLAELLELGVDPNVQDKSGGTVLHHLAINATSSFPLHRTFVWKAFDILLRHGGEPTVQDNNGTIPLDYFTDFRSFAPLSTAVFLLIQSMVKSGL